MHSEHIQPLVALGDFVTKIVSAIAHGEPPCYPVLGAEGRDFFIEAATGPFESRQILRTIHVEIHHDLDYPVLPNLPNADDEPIIALPSAAFLIGLVGLFQRALNANALILHPLNSSGDFLQGWDQAVIAASLKRLP